MACQRRWHPWFSWVGTLLLASGGGFLFGPGRAATMAQRPSPPDSPQLLQPDSATLPTGLSISAQVGLGGQFRPGSWTPIQLLLTYALPGVTTASTGRDQPRQWTGYAGVVITRPGTLTGVPITLTYRTPVVAASPAHLALDFVVPLLSAYDSVRWQLWDAQGRPQATGPIPVLARSAAHPVWLVVQERASSTADPAWTTMGTPPVRIQFLADPQECPVDALSYDGVDLIVADRFGWARLPERAWAALRGWLQTGGLLLVTRSAQQEASRDNWLGQSGSAATPLPSPSPEASDASPTAGDLAEAILWQRAGLGWIGWASWSLDDPPWPRQAGAAYDWLRRQLPRFGTQPRLPIVPLVVQAGRSWQPPLDLGAVAELTTEPLVWPSRTVVGLVLLVYLSIWILWWQFRPRPSGRQRIRPGIWATGAVTIGILSTIGVVGWAHSWQSLTPQSRAVRVALGTPNQSMRWTRTYLVAPNPSTRQPYPLPIDPSAAAGILPFTDLYPAGDSPLALTGQADDPFWQLEIGVDGRANWRGRTSLAALTAHQIVADDRLALTVRLQSGAARTSGSIVQIRSGHAQRFSAGLVLSSRGPVANWSLRPGQTVSLAVPAEVLTPLAPRRSPAWDPTTVRLNIDEFWSQLRQRWTPARQLAASQGAFVPKLAAALAAIWIRARASPNPVLIGWEWEQSAADSPPTVYLYDLEGESR